MSQPHGQTRTRRQRSARPDQPIRVHFLDVGEKEYGDAVLCELNGRRVLIDGAHPGDQTGSPGHLSIPQQLASLLGGQVPVRIDLLVVTHAHQDHIGCLPSLVEQHLIDVEWALVADPGLSWGQPLDTPVAPAAPDARIAAVAAGLREELLIDDADHGTVAQFLVDAVSLEQRYRAMLATLESRGTRVVRHGRDSARALLRAFAQVGLEILGPSQEQLLVCAEAIARLTRDAAARAADLISQDSSASEPELYRALVAGARDALDAGRPGPAINLQSIVTRFSCREAKLLFAGDMQFADPQLSAPIVRDELAQLRAAIGAKAPYSLVKLSHHGSDNAFDQSVLAELGKTPIYGICVGEESLSHPNPRVLRLLDASRDQLDWVRTDRNGLVSIEFNGEPRVTLSRGMIDDPRPNTPDATPAGQAISRPQSRALVTTTEVPGARVVGEHGDGYVEVTTWVPRDVERVTVTIEVDRRTTSPVRTTSSDAAITLELAGGRRLPPLLFVTNRELLGTNIGVAETDAILGAIEGDTTAILFDELPVDPLNPASSPPLVAEQLRRWPELQGVVLLGGPTVVPAQRLDCLPAVLRQRLGHTDDPDDFIVWSDEAYGDRDGDLIAELPVTRIPDGNSAELMIATLSATNEARRPERTGVRNVARPFAEDIFALLPGANLLLGSQPTTYDVAPHLGGEHVYLMLHGDHVDSSRFWGEGTEGDVEAVNLTNVTRPAGRIVFTGCCWGALTADQPALSALPGTAPAGKAAGASLALAFLREGSTAFVGCTGAHYSPTEEPYGYFGGPMHGAFWKRILAGAPPAEALFRAKIDYVAGFPHGRRTALQQAIEHKILHQYTCLGLGW